MKKLYSPFDFNIVMHQESVAGNKVTRHHLTDLAITSGQIITEDPLVFSYINPLNKMIPLGTYPLHLYVASLSAYEDRVALAVLQLKDEKAVNFEMAHNDAQDMSVLQEGYIYGFPVDAGMGTIIDTESAVAYLQYMDKRSQQDPDFDSYNFIFDAMFGEREKDESVAPGLRTSLVYEIPDSEGVVVPLIHSGFGDGYYPVYWGLNAQEEIVNVVIDFQIFGEGDS